MRLALAVTLIALLAACSGGGDAPALLVDTPPESTPAASVTPAPTPDGRVTIAAVGDVMLARDLVDLMDANGALYPFELVLPLLEDADLTIANMEGAFTDGGIEDPKLYTFRTPPRFAAGLARAGIDLVSLGNNHAMDYGAEGLADTLAALEAAGVAYAGAGADEAAARTPALFTVDGVRLAFLSYNDFFEATFAEPDRPGVARATVASITADVRAVRAGAEVVVVSLHAGVEYTDAPQPEQRALARAAIDAGALLVLGHHPHTLQGWEEYGGGLIIYSLGNFVFDLDADDLANLGSRAFETAVVYVTIDTDAVLDVRAEPVFIDVAENRPRPATQAEGSAILARLEQLHTLATGP